MLLDRNNEGTLAPLILTFPFMALTLTLLFDDVDEKGRLPGVGVVHVLPVGVLLELPVGVLRP